MNLGLSNGIELAEKGYLPDWVIRRGIRGLLRRRLREIDLSDCRTRREHLRRFLARNADQSIALVPDKANRQHYEVPSGFFQLVLGARLKYSSAIWPEGVDTLDQAEEAMLDLTCRRAALADGLDILELGCGWGSLTIWMAEHYPKSRILAVSNSRSQKKFIDESCAARGLDNVRVVTADVNEFDIDQLFDRVVSVEMFEHVHNHRRLMRRIGSWLRPDGKLFIHVFCHRDYAYDFDVDGADNWMGRHFFSGGIMPSDDMFLYLQDSLTIEEHWRVPGRHYARTAQAWLENLDRRRTQVVSLFGSKGDGSDPGVMFRRWRLFFMACQELFAYRGGQEWWVSHYLFQR